MGANELQCVGICVFERDFLPVDFLDHAAGHRIARDQAHGVHGRGNGGALQVRAREFDEEHAALPLAQVEGPAPVTVIKGSDIDAGGGLV